MSGPITPAPRSGSSTAPTGRSSPASSTSIRIPQHEPLYRGVREEHGLPSMHMTGLYERWQAFSAPDDEARAASAEFAYCELLRCGRHLARRHLGAVGRLGRAVRQSGMRGFLAPGYASARWYSKTTTNCYYAWDEARGRAGSTPRSMSSTRRRRSIRAAGFPASSRRCRSTPAPRICCATATTRRASAACRSPCTSRRASSRCAR